MSGMYAVTNALLAAVTLGTTSLAHASNDDATLRAELERISHRRIFFGHQSVGVNILDGIRQLSATADVPVNIVEATASSAVQPATIGHVFVVENGKPLQKLKSFEQAMGTQPSKLDIALVKFCYIDFNADTNVKEIFASYRTSLENLRIKNPGTTFVHVTAPLTVVHEGIKIRLKKLLGKAPPDAIENLRREQYNTLLRQTYQGKEPIFDLARIESTKPDGSLETVSWDGQSIPVLVPEYSDDGGHLNAAGKLRAARELVSVLAAVPDRSAAQ